MILTVSIPTFDRPEKVRNTLLKLIPQLTPEVFVLILDNCSTINVKSFLESEIPQLSELNNITIYRNPVNIGPDANFARCFEYSKTIYTWTLGDDDDVDVNAIDRILFDIEHYKDYDLIGFNFNSNCNFVERNKPIIVNSTKSLVNEMDFFGNWLFLSTSVYKTQEYLKYIRYAYSSAYSMSSQISPALVAISNNKTFVFSEKYIVTNVPIHNVDEKWSNVKITLTLTSLLELPLKLKHDEYMLLGKKMNKMYVAFPHVLYSILKSVNMNIDLIDDYHIYLFKQIYSRTFSFRYNKVKQAIRYFLILFMLKNKFVLKILSNNNLLKGKTSHVGVAKFNLFVR